MSPGKTLRGSVWSRTGLGTEGPSLGDRSACSSMKKNQTMQGTFSKLFGKKHAHPSTTSLYATNPPWIFTHEAQEEGTRDFGECTPAGGKKKKKNKGEFPVAPLPSWLWRHLGAGKAGWGRDTLEPVDRLRRCWEGEGGAAARVREVQGTPEVRPPILAALTCRSLSPFITFGRVSVCVAVFAVSPTTYPHSESEI